MRCARCKRGFLLDVKFGGETFQFCGSCNSFNVLDKGFIALVDFVGGDEMVVRAARISYGKETKGVDQDKKLIKYMMEHRHGTPFEHSLFIFHVKAPIFVARQWFRHRIGSFNEISGRYVEYEDDFYIPKKLRIQHPKNKQASIYGDIPGEDELISLYEEVVRKSYEVYKRFLQAGVAREISRTILPLSLYTQFYWSVNPRSLMNFINLRASEDAQEEIREYAKRISFFFYDRMPWTFSSFVKYAFDGKSQFIQNLKEKLENL